MTMLSKTETRELAKGMAFISPWVIGFAVFTLAPVCLCLYYSFCKFNLLTPPRWIGLDNYRTMLSDATFWQATRNTTVYTAMAVPAGTLVSLGLAMLLTVQIPGRAVWRAIIFLPSLVPTVAAAMVWMWLLNAKLGLVNIMIEKLGIDPPQWLADPAWALPALAFMSLWGVGNAVVIYLAGLQDVPRELYEAAELDGAGIWARMWHVTLPMLSPVIFFNLVVAIIGTLKYFDMPYIMSAIGLGPGHSAYVLSMYVYDNAFLYVKMGYAAALGWVLLLMVLLLTAVAFWSSKRWVHYEGK
jgi:multiple sugar transport system permease protein